MTTVPPIDARHEQFEDLLRCAAPLQDSQTQTPAVRAAMAGLAREVIAASEPVVAPSAWAGGWGRARRKIAGLGVATTAWTLVATGVATAGGLTLYDAWYDGPDSTESIRSEPYVDVRSDEFAAGFAQNAAMHPLPLGADYDQLYGNTLAAGGLKQVSGAAGQIVMVSICAWSSEWLRAHDARDNQAEQAAVNRLERAAGSPELAAIDGGGIVSNLTAVATAAAGSDRAIVSAHVDTCSAALR